MADYKVLVPFIKRFEGGFVNDPKDRGGATNKGITMNTWRIYCNRKGKTASVATLKAVTDAEWNDVFKSMYWDRCKADDINDQSVANMLVDWYWNSGRWAVKHLQRIINVADDGVIGNKTLTALNSFNAVSLFDRLKQDRLKFVENIARNNPSQKRFLRGWKNRINAIVRGGFV